MRVLRYAASCCMLATIVAHRFDSNGFNFGLTIRSLELQSRGREASGPPPAQFPDGVERKFSPPRQRGLNRECDKKNTRVALSIDGPGTSAIKEGYYGDTKNEIHALGTSKILHVSHGAKSSVGGETHGPRLDGGKMSAYGEGRSVAMSIRPPPGGVGKIYTYEASKGTKVVSGYGSNVIHAGEASNHRSRIYGEVDRPGKIGVKALTLPETNGRFDSPPRAESP